MLTKKSKRFTPTEGGAKPLIVVDTREQAPYKFRADGACAGCVTRKLDYGDYQVDGYSTLVVVERKKNVDELCGNIGKHRERFERELQRMQVCRWRFVVVEDYYSSIQKPRFSKIHPQAILGSIISLELKYGVRFLFCGNRKFSCRMTKKILMTAYKYRDLPT